MSPLCRYLNVINKSWASQIKFLHLFTLDKLWVFDLSRDQNWSPVTSPSFWLPPSNPTLATVTITNSPLSQQTFFNAKMTLSSVRLRFSSSVFDFHPIFTGNVFLSNFVQLHQKHNFCRGHSDVPLVKRTNCCFSLRITLFAIFLLEL